MLVPVRQLLYRVQGSGFRIQSSEFRVQGSGFRVQGSGFRVQGSVFSVQCSVFSVHGPGTPARRREAGGAAYRPIRNPGAPTRCQGASLSNGSGSDDTSEVRV